MRSIRTYELKLLSLSSPEIALLTEIQFLIRCGQFSQFSDVIRIKDMNQKLPNCSFEVKPRSSEDWSILIECWDYNALTHQLDKSILGSILVDLSNLKPSEPEKLCHFQLKSPYQHEVVLDLDCSIKYTKQPIRTKQLDINSVGPDREMQRMLLLINIEKEPGKTMSQIKASESRNLQKLDHSFRATTPEIKRHSPLHELKPTQNSRNLRNLSPFQAASSFQTPQSIQKGNHHQMRMPPPVFLRQAPAGPPPPQFMQYDAQSIIFNCSFKTMNFFQNM